MLCASDGESRAKFAHQVAELKRQITETLSSKLSHHDMIPWKASGGFGEHFGLKDEGRECLKQCIAELDSAMANPKQRRAVHRISRRLFSLEGDLRAMIEGYVQYDMELTDIPALFVEMQELSLAPLVERSVEVIHASIKAETA